MDVCYNNSAFEVMLDNCRFVVCLVQKKSAGKYYCVLEVVKSVLVLLLDYATVLDLLQGYNIVVSTQNSYQVIG